MEEEHLNALTIFAQRLPDPVLNPVGYNFLDHAVAHG
jgi:hypothetical protein